MSHARPRILDAFCGAGGCSVGYHRAGWGAVGIDITAQPRYPFEFRKGDALEALFMLDADGFDAIHASPPCQDYSRAMRHLSGDYERLIEPVRELLISTGLPWVMENVPGSPLPTAATLDGRFGVELCGSMFGLRIRRHRLFETSFPISPPKGCDHRKAAMNPHFAPSRELIRTEFGLSDAERPWRAEMGVEWMTREEGREAIPPVFTEFIGAELLRQLASPPLAPAGANK